MVARKQQHRNVHRSSPTCDATRKEVDGRVPPGPPWIGAHLSIAGGIDRAALEAVRLGMNTFQLFTASPQIWPVQLEPSIRKCTSQWKNPDSWTGEPLDGQQIARFVAAVDRYRLYRPIAHSCYLINLAATDDVLWGRSVAALVCELRRAGQLGLSHVVVHPGAATDGNPTKAVERVIMALDEVAQRRTAGDARLMLENTAGQGRTLGWQFEQLAEILARLRNPDWVDICIDTCHAYAAGYDLRTRPAWKRVKRQLAATVGWSKIQAWHVNDSKRELGSRVDRHEHIGHGQLGLDAFGWLLTDDDARRIPMYLETPKGQRGKRSWDEVNLETLRRCAERST